MNNNILKLILFFIIFLPSILSAQPANYLIGAYYYSGWWSNPPSHFFNKNGDDIRLLVPDREPLIGWYDDKQYEVDNEIIIAAENGLDFFAFDFYTSRPDPKNSPGAHENNNNGLKFYETSIFKTMLKFAIVYVNSSYYAITTQTEWDQYTTKWINYFKDNHYLKINGKPVFIILGAPEFVSNWKSFSAANQAINSFREKAKAAGIPEILIGAGLANTGVNGAFVKKYNALNIDFFTSYADGVHYLPKVETQYSELLHYLPSNWEIFKNNSTIPFIPTTIQGYDPRPLLENYVYFVNASPELFKQQLLLAKKFHMDNPSMRLDGQSISLVYAWNELTEGGILDPHKSDLGRYLEQIRVLK